MDERLETFLDHLVKLSTGSLYILGPLIHWLVLYVDRQVLKDELLNILVASKDTVSISRVPWFFSLMLF